MKLSKLFDGYSRFIEALTWVPLVVAIIMVLLIVYNITGRYIFRTPLFGTIEMIEMAIVIVAFLGVVAYTEVRRAHVRVEVLISRFPRRVQIILESIMKFIAAVFFVLMGWQSWELMLTRLFPRVMTTDLVNIPMGPFMGVIALGCVLLSIQLLIHCYQNLASLKTGDREE